MEEEVTQSSASQAPIDAPQVSESKTEPLNNDQLKSGMLDAINSELDTKVVSEEQNKEQDKEVLDKDKPDTKAAVKDADKKIEKPHNDPYAVPEGLKTDSQKRFHKLVEVAKEATAKAEEIRKSLESHEETITNFRSILEETHTSPEDLSGLLEYNRMVKTGDLEGALQLLDEQRSIIGKYLGRPVDGVDYLDGHEDIRKELSEGKISPQRAAEISRARNIELAQRQRNEIDNKNRQEVSQRETQINSALDGISKFVAEKSASDIDFKKKEEILLNAVDDISQNFPPHLWLKQIEILYRTISSVPAAQAIPAAVPLRPNSGGGGKPQPKSMADAIDMALGYGAP